MALAGAGGEGRDPRFGADRDPSPRLESGALARAAHDQIIAFVLEMIAERRRAPLDPEEDITSALLARESGESPWTTT